MHAALACLAIAMPSPSPQAPPGSVRDWEHEASDLSVDPRIRFGSLENGLRFAWMANPEPNKRCYVRLHVDVGALAEEDAQDGMAHFLEHMAFNGSRNFAAGTLIEWFQEHGMEFGADLNASTSWSETVYKLDLPHSDEATLREAFTVLRDWADGLLLEQEEIDREKGVVDGEQTAGDSAGRRVFERLIEEQYAGTRYTLRDVIGEREVRAAFDAEGVRAFYERWYRPEAMTVVLVGDLGELDPTALIEEAFASLAVPPSPVPPEPPIGAVALEDRSFGVFEPEIPTVTVHLERLVRWEEEPDDAATRVEDIDLRCAERMLGLRYDELAKKEGTPFLSAGISPAGGLEVYDGQTLSVLSEPQKWKDAFALAEYELRRALQHGFEQAELDEVRADWLRALDEAVEREPTRHSRSFVSEILHAAEERSVPTTAATERALLGPVLEALSPEDCHAALLEAWSQGVTHLYTTGNLDLGQEADEVLRATYAELLEREVVEREAVATAAWAYASDPERAGEVVADVHVEDLDVHLVAFANGVRLTVKATDFQQRQILVQARLAEGMLALPPQDYAVGWVAAQGTADLAGLEAHSVDDLRRLMAGKQAGLSFAMGGDAFVFNGGTTAEDLLFELELLCAALEHHGRRDDGLRMLRDRLPLIFERFRHVPNGPLVLEFLPALLNGDPRLVGLPTRAAIEAVTMDAIEAALAPHFARGPLEVTIVGDLEVDAAVAAAARTIGVLPERREREAHAERRVVAPPKSGVVMEREIETEDDKSFVMMVFPTDDGLEVERRRELSFLTQVVQDRLRLEVREKLGAAYSPVASGDTNRVFPGIGTLSLIAQVEPAKVPTLLEAFRGVARDLHEGGVSPEEVKRLSEPLLAQIRDARRTNAFWMEVLSEAQSRPAVLDEMRTLESFYRGMKAEALSARAKAHLDPERASWIVVHPAAEEAAEGTPVEAGGADD